MHEGDSTYPILRVFDSPQGLANRPLFQLKNKCFDPESAEVGPTAETWYCPFAILGCGLSYACPCSWMFSFLVLEY